jgi:hypothetical protein
LFVNAIAESACCTKAFSCTSPDHWCPFFYYDIQEEKNTKYRQL